MDTPSFEFLRLCLSGDVGSGKGTVGEVLKEKLEIPLFSTGQCQRALAEKKGMTTLELNQYAEDHPEIDFEIDQISKDLAQGNQNFIIDSRLAWSFIPDSFKIFLTVKEEEAAKRILNDHRQSELYTSFQQASQAIRARKHSEQERYFNLYRIDLRDFSHYDLVIDTSDQEVGVVVDLILTNFRDWQKDRQERTSLSN